MSSYRFDRSEYYACLLRHDALQDEAIARRRQADCPYLPVAPHWDGFRYMRIGARAERVRQAITESETIALRALQSRLAGIALDDIWPVLRHVCHDIALYIGGSALAGGAIGGGLGLLVFGGDALPGATAGALLGAQAGDLLLGFLGLKDVVGYMLDSVPRAIREYIDGFREAWGPIPDLRPGSFDGPHYGADYNPGTTYIAAHAFARGHEILVVALLAGIVAYLGRGNGKLTALLTEVRQNARLGPKMADWLAQNEGKLASHPLLNARGKGTGGGAIGDGQAGAPSASGSRAAKRGARAESAAGATLRDAAQVVGKSEGGPGTWQLSPKRSAGEVYQEQISGVRRGIEYEVPAPDLPSGKVRFDGYDAQRKVLLDAKDWKWYPPQKTKFWRDSTVLDALRQIDAAHGVPIEWHFSTLSGLEEVRTLFEYENIREISLVLTPML